MEIELTSGMDVFAESRIVYVFPSPSNYQYLGSLILSTLQPTLLFLLDYYKTSSKYVISLHHLQKELLLAFC